MNHDEIQVYFGENRYAYINGAMTSELCTKLIDCVFTRFRNGDFVYDHQCPKSPAMYGDKYLDMLLEDIKPTIERCTGKKLSSNYSYARIYGPNDVLDFHTDRKECEYSVTMNLGYLGTNWPICISEKQDKSDKKAITIEAGDMLIYKGMELFHWRESAPKDMKWLCQVFLHYNDVDSIYFDKKFDGRNELGSHSPKKIRDFDNEFYYLGRRKENKTTTVTVDDFIQPPLIDLIVNYGKRVGMMDGKIGYGSGKNVIDKDIRSVLTVGLPFDEFEWLYKAIALKIRHVNYMNYKFHLDKIEKLTYMVYDADSLGHYNAHVDTPISENRKLSFSCLLSDPSEFEGGDLIVYGGSKTIAEKRRGSMTLFPSWTQHEIKPVTSGLRRSLVGWIHGNSMV